MEPNPTVTVVIPFNEDYTPPEMLEEAKVSAKSQSIPVDVTVVHDADGRGPAWARNRGLERSDTRYIAFLDADDLWKEDKLERQLQRMEDTGAGLCVEGTSMTKQEFIKAVFVGGVHSLTSSILVDVDRVDVSFEESLERMEDWLFAMEAASQADVCFCEELVEIRKHDGGLSSRGSLGLVVGQLDRFGELALERVPETRPYADEFFRTYHFLRGRFLHSEGRHREAIGEFIMALRCQLHYEPVGGLALSIVALVYSRLNPLSWGTKRA